jgi:hypothetical protein
MDSVAAEEDGLAGMVPLASRGRPLYTADEPYTPYGGDDMYVVALNNALTPRARAVTHTLCARIRLWTQARATLSCPTCRFCLEIRTT